VRWNNNLWVLRLFSNEALFYIFKVKSASNNSLAIDIIIPLYNEEDSIPALHKQLCNVIDQLSFDFKIWYVNDGSTDETQKIIQGFVEEDKRVIVLELSRNFGHQAALTAGLDESSGDFVITMDGDGQHPPGLIPEMIKLAESGYDVVIAQRVENENPTFKNITSRLFYRLVNLVGDTNILAGAADFRLLRKSVVDSLRTMREYHRLLRGMVAWMGYRSIILPYKQPDRLGGKSKYSFRKMLRLATHAIFSFSLIPLYMGISVGAIFLLLALAEVIYVLSFWITGAQSSLAPGWSSLMFILLFVGGCLLITLGFIGIYVGYIFQEVKRRPIYLLKDIKSGDDIRNIHQSQISDDPGSE
jgi:polyisoprenyl-phosphate glycosyltransferase